MYLLKASKITKFTTSIVCTMMMLLFIAHLAPSKAQEVFSFEFNDTMTDDKTVAVYKGDTTLNDVHSTIKHSFPTITITGSIWIGNSLKFIQSHLNLSNTSKTITSDWGTWHVNISNSICEENYYCSTVRFVPNVSKINSEAFGATISTILAARILSTFERKAVNLDFKREDINMEWRDHEGDVKDSTVSPDIYRLHDVDLEIYSSDISEISFELWITDGNSPVEKNSFNRGNYTLITQSNNQIHHINWQGIEWYYVSSYGTWVIGGQDYCQENTNKYCLNAVYTPNDSAENL